MQRLTHWWTRGYVRLVAFLDRLYGPHRNLIHLSTALAVALIAVEIITGTYLFIFYRIDPLKTYDTLLQIQAFPVHRWMRALHRYASDGLMVLALVHALHMITVRRVYRTMAWIGGIATILLVLFTGVTGFLLVWDQSGKLTAIWMGKLLAVLPVFDTSFLNALLKEDLRMLSGFFRVNVFLHLLFTGVLAFTIWFHLNHTARPQWLPPWKAAAIFIGALAVFSAVFPAPLDEPANARVLPSGTKVSVFYALFLSGVQRVDPAVWMAGLAGLGLLTALLPVYKRRRRRGAVPRIIDEKCIGCNQCVVDCPYEAITLTGEPYQKGAVAVIDEEKCVRCGICLGSCKFDAVAWPPGEQLREAAESAKPLLVCCEDWADTARSFDGVDVATVPCAADVLPAWYVEQAEHRPKVVVAHCGWCAFREGHQWHRQRMERKRRPPVPLKDAVRKVWTTEFHKPTVERLLREAEPPSERRVNMAYFRHKGQYAAFAVTAAVVVALLVMGSQVPVRGYPDDVGWAAVSLRFVTLPKYKELSTSGVSHMQSARVRMVEGRSPLRLIMRKEDGTVVHDALFEPPGIRNDLPVQAYFEVGDTGRLEVETYQVWKPDSTRHTFEVDLRPGCSYHVKITEEGHHIEQKCRTAE